MSAAEAPLLPENAESILLPLAAVQAPACPFCGAPMGHDRPFCAACGQPGAPLAAETVLHGAYRIVDTIASGATGAVYRAQHRRHKGEVAIKELLSPVGSAAAARAALADRFTHEARHLAHLKHPCLPEIVDHFSQDGRHYLVTALLPGSDLQRILAERGQGFPEAHVRIWATRLLDLLAYLEERRPPFVHGEIMPAHLMLRADGMPCLVGYGLAPRLGLRPYLTLPGQAPSALPEKAGARGRKQTAPAGPTLRDDLYGLGATLHALLTGRDVLVGSDDPARPYPSAHDLAPRVSVGMAEVVGQATAPEARRRFAAAAPFQAALAALPPPPAGTLGPLQAHPRPASRTQRQGHGTRILAVAILLAALAVLGSLAVYIHDNQPSGAGTAATGEANPLSTAPLPAPLRTTPLNEYFAHAGTLWPNVAGQVMVRGAQLTLDNTQGTAPLKLTSTSYSTGRDGFTLRAVLHLAQGDQSALYGLIAADRSGTQWENLALLVRADGAWAVLHYHGGHAPALVPWQHARAVRAGHNSPNELTLTLVPGAQGYAGRLRVAINGVPFTSALPAPGVAPTGRIGIVAGPGARVIADALTVSKPSSAAPLFEEHFLDNSRGWTISSGGAQSLQAPDGVLRLRGAPGRAWLAATAPHFGPGLTTSAFTVETDLSVHAPSTGAGGVLLAAGPAGAGTTALAAVLDGGGRVAIVAPMPNGLRLVAGPAGGLPARTGFGTNVLRATVHLTATGKIRVQVTLNGVVALRYSGPAAGLTPASGIVAAGTKTTVTASALRIWM